MLSVQFCFVYKTANVLSQMKWYLLQPNTQEAETGGSRL